MNLFKQKFTRNTNTKEKGKHKKEKKYFSIVVVPHSSDKVYKISGLFSRYVIVCAVFVAVLLSIISSSVYIWNENSKLKSDNVTLENISSEQSRLLDEKAQEIQGLIEKEESLNNTINGFNDKVREITEEYMGNRTSSRSGDLSGRTFAGDISELTAMIENVEKLQGANVNVSSGLAETQENLKAYLETVPSIYPTSGRISSNFGKRKDPFNLTSANHSGIDIAAPYGQNIKAAAKGVVTQSARTTVYGYTITLDHGRGITTMYGHCSKLLVKKGDVVEKGDLIAKVGNSGRSTGAHLHFEVRINGTTVDPLKYISK